MPGCYISRRTTPGPAPRWKKRLQTTKDGSIIEHYGDVLYQLGEKDKALLEWQRAHKAGGTSNQLERKLKEHRLYE